MFLIIIHSKYHALIKNAVVSVPNSQKDEAVDPTVDSTTKDPTTAVPTSGPSVNPTIDPTVDSTTNNPTTVVPTLGPSENPAERFDCFPEGGATKEKCIERG